MTLSSAGKSVSELADLYIAPDTRGYSLVDFTAMEELIPIGYNATMEAIEKQANNEEFLAKFGLKLGDIPEKLPRIEVPRWKSLERERRQLRSAMFYQAILVFCVCGVFSTLVQLVLYGNINASFSLLFGAGIASIGLLQGMVKIVAKMREGKRLQAAQAASNK